MTSRRKGLLLVLLVLVVLPLSGAFLMGDVEVLLWLALLVAWAVLFVTWGGRRGRPTPTAQ